MFVPLITLKGFIVSVNIILAVPLLYPVKLVNSEEMESVHLKTSKSSS